MKNTLTRRDFLKVLGIGSVGAAAMMLASCGKDSGAETSSNTAGSTASAGSSGTAAQPATGTTNFTAAEAGEVITSSTVAGENFEHITVIGNLPGTLDGGNHGHLWSACSYECLAATNPDDSLYGQLIDGSKGADGYLYEHTAGSTDYDVHLYEYIVDGNGNPLTADDVVYSYEWHIANGKARGFTFYDSIEAVDTYTVRFHMKEEVNRLGGMNTYFTSLRCFTRKSFEESGESFAMSAVTTGPYDIADFQADVSITLKKKENYWQDPDLINPLNTPNVEEILINKTGETAQSIIALETGNADLLENLGYMNAAPFLEGGEYYGKFNTMVVDGTSIYTLYPNVDAGSVMSDLNLRLAVFYALNGDQLTAAMGTGVGTRVTCWGNPIASDYDPSWETIDSYITGYDPEKAKEYLKKSSYKGESLRILYGNFDGNFGTISAVVQNMLDAVGIKSEISAYDMANFGAVHEDPKTWELWLTTAGGQSGGYVASAWFSSLDYNNRKPGGTTQFFAHDDDMQALVEPIVLPETHTAENMNAVYQYLLDQAYFYPICTVKSVSVFSLAIDMSSVVLTSNNAVKTNALKPAK